ncbi:MAG: regulatory protein RecX [candidate division NC10 bacterium]|nr:regulatory protein RecX [candidate division NC10 bacterium]
MGLRKKGFPPSEIEEVIERLIEERLLDDGRLAQDLAFSKVPHKLWGRDRIRQELVSRGVSIEQVAEAIAQVYAEYPEEELALRAARKKWRSVLARDSLRARQKVGSYLQRQGFAFETIIKALDSLKD